MHAHKNIKGEGNNFTARGTHTHSTSTSLSSICKPLHIYTNLISIVLNWEDFLLLSRRRANKNKACVLAGSIYGQ